VRARSQGLATVYLGLGSNLGKREENLRNALKSLAGKVEVMKVSSFYETEPQGYKEQPLFLNAACEITTDLRPREVLALAREIEKRMGRKPAFRNAPREIDIDILLYDGLKLDTAELTIPHPRLRERAFVLVPLAEIAPGLVEPVTGKSVATLLSEVEGKEGVRRTESTQQGHPPEADAVPGIQ